MSNIQGKALTAEDRRLIEVLHGSRPEIRLARIEEIVRELIELGAHLSTLAEHGCNRELTGPEQRNQTSYEARVAELCFDLKVDHRTQRDPRGCVIKLVFYDRTGHLFYNSDDKTWGLR